MPEDLQVKINMDHLWALYNGFIMYYNYFL